MAKIIFIFLQTNYRQILYFFLFNGYNFNRHKKLFNHFDIFLRKIIANVCMGED